MQLQDLRFSLQYRYKQLLFRLPFSKGKAYTPFLIVGHGRSGSTWLHTLLSSHPNVWSWGEELRPYRQQGSFQPMKRAFQLHYPQKIKAVGSKFFYDDLKLPGGELFLQEWIVAGKPVIHLYRRNVLRAIISEQRAMHFKEWSSRKKGGRLAKLPFRLADGLLRIAALDKQRQAMQVRLANAVSYTLSYEELCSEPKLQQQKLLQFLGLPHFSLYSPLHQQNAAPMQDLLTNYDELRNAMEEKGWQKFLD